MDLFDFLQKHAEQFTVILGALGTLFVSWSRIKKFILKKWNERRDYIKSRNAIPETLKQIQISIYDVDDRLRAVEKEVTPNGGGSMKDALKIIKAEIEATFWLNPKPSFRTTSSGLNIQVNESYCHLCGTSSEDLLRHNWKNYIEDEQQLEDYDRRWYESTASFSQFSSKLKFKNSRGESVGEWVIKVRPLGAIDGGHDYLWHGTLYPHDQKAKEHAKSYNIPLN